MDTLLVGLVTLLTIGVISRFRFASFDNYVVLADAFLHGRIAINHPSPWIDAMQYQGKYYVIEGPIPALLMLPLVAVYGLGANQTVLAACLAAVAIGASWEIGKSLGIPVSTRLWLCGFLLFGTDLCWCAMLGDVWFLAHVSAVAFTLLALAELHGKRRAFVIAICAACAAGSRFSMLAAMPIYAFLLTRETNTALRKGSLLIFAMTLAPFALLWIGYNEARWHLPYDPGYTLWYRRGDPRSLDPIGTGSPFDLRYLRYELHAFFIRFPKHLATYPYFVPELQGVALTWTSPALILAFLARRPRHWIAALWAGVLLTAAPNLIYYADGFDQFGMRHALDFAPFLLVLMFLGTRERLPQWGKILCAYSMLVGLWGIWYWLHFYRAF